MSDERADSHEDAATLAILRDAARDPAAFAPLYREYAPVVYRFCHRQLGDAERAADATSQTFVKVLSSVRTFQPHPDQPGKTFRAWLFRIATNVVIDTRRKERPSTSFSADDEADVVTTAYRDPAPTPEEIALAAEEARAVRAAVLALPERQRLIIELRLADLSGAEIAAAMEMPISAVKSAQFRAFANLRRLLAEHHRADCVPPCSESLSLEPTPETVP